MLGTTAISAALGTSFAWLVPNHDELASRLAAEAEAKLGVKVTLGSARWRMFPPALMIENAATVQPQPIKVSRLEARPHLRFRNLTWITRHGIALDFDGHARFDAAWRPREAELVRPGVEPATQLSLAREGDTDNWQVRIKLGGGTADGQVLTRSLHTRTDFSVVPATLLRIDMDKAIRTFGKDRAGQTQNTPAGMVVTYSAIQAKGEAFSAQGQGTIANRRIDGELKVDLAGGLAGVSLKVTGPLGAPQVTVPPAAMLAAALAGAGVAIGKLFGARTRATSAPRSPPTRLPSTPGSRASPRVKARPLPEPTTCIHAGRPGPSRSAQKRPRPGSGGRPGFGWRRRQSRSF